MISTPSLYHFTLASGLSTLHLSLSCFFDIPCLLFSNFFENPNSGSGAVNMKYSPGNSLFKFHNIISTLTLNFEVCLAWKVVALSNNTCIPSTIALLRIFDYQSENVVIVDKWKLGTLVALLNKTPNSIIWKVSSSNIHHPCIKFFLQYQQNPSGFLLLQNSLSFGNKKKK